MREQVTAAAELHVRPDFRMCLRVRPEDIDDLGHVSNIVYLRWIQDVASAHSTAVGWTREAYQQAGCIFVVRRHEIEYLASALPGDQIELVTWIEDWALATSARMTRILRARDRRELARATTSWVLIDANSGRPRRIPPEISGPFTQPSL
jgi:acyl-CoA thioester hydrolase